MCQKTILLAEDDVLLRNALGDKLARVGFTAHVARTGQECLDKAFAYKPDLILLDILMPGKNGFEVLKELRSDAWGATVKVIILSNVKDAEKSIEQNPYRIDGYLIKSHTKMADVVEQIEQELDIVKLVETPSVLEAIPLPEYRCTCGKLLFKGVLLFSTIQVKCKRCGVVRLIDTSDQNVLG